jgi:hypothetical protein
VSAYPPFIAPAGQPPQAPATRTVFASVLAKDGSPVTDLTAADFEIKEGGMLQPVQRDCASIRDHLPAAGGRQPG